MYRVNPFHPNSIYLISENKKFNLYFEELKRKFPYHDYILNIGDYEVNNYSDYGFIEFRRTYDLNIELNRLLNCFFENKENIVQRASTPFTLSNQLIKKWYEIYKKTHKVNPVKSFNLEEFKEKLAEGLDFENSIVIFNTQCEIIAYALIYDDSKDTKEVGYVYFKDTKSKQQLLEILFNRLIYLNNKGIHSIVTEVDTTDKYAYEIFGAFIDDSTAYMKTLIYKSKMTKLSSRNIEHDDINYVLNWSKDIHFCLSNGWPLNRTNEAIFEWWNYVIESQSDSFQRKMLVSNKTIIGYYDLYIHNDNIIELGIAIGDKNFRNKGYGSLLFSKITAEVSRKYPSKDIIAITDKTNIVAQRMIIKSGYRVENSDKYKPYITNNELVYRYI